MTVLLPLAKRLFLVVFASLIISLNINSFVRAGDLFPGGFTGLALLIQELAARFAGVHIPFSAINVVLNAFPAFISFRFIGHKFTVYSCIAIVLTSLFTDLLPSLPVTEDVLLVSVFGGLVNAFGISLCLLAGASGGGSDFIAIYFSERRGKDAWNYVLAGNAFVLVIAGFFFGWNRALYSIFFQFTSTQVLKLLHQRYQRLTMLIITSKPNEVYAAIRDITHHDATLFCGIGCYKQTERNMLYSVVSADEIRRLMPIIKHIDAAAFINVLKTQRINGRFYQKPND